MIELINPISGAANIRCNLLANVSAMALLCIAAASHADAQDDKERPTVWIEMGAQLERATSDQEPFAPPLTSQFLTDGFLQPASVQRPPRYSNGIEGAISIAPDDSPWTFTASVRYGRANTGRTSHHQTSTPPVYSGIISIPAFGIHFTNTASPMALRFANASFRGNESHLLLDFMAGRDLGLGSSFSFNAGIRVAQFTSKSRVNITANPGGVMPFKYATQLSGLPVYINRPDPAGEVWDIYRADATISRSFRGIGPSLSVMDSVPLAGNRNSMLISLDLGANGALLFGKQKAMAHHVTNDDRPVIPHPYNFIPMTNYYHHTYNRTRSRSAIVPNVGGFAGLSFKYSNAKIKLGYRADVFFNAIDGGIDTRRTYNRGLYGPYAAISIGFP